MRYLVTCAISPDGFLLLDLCANCRTLGPIEVSYNNSTTIDYGLYLGELINTETNEYELFLLQKLSDSPRVISTPIPTETRH